MAETRPILMLDALRFGCAGFVMMHHYGAVFPAAPPPLVGGRAAIPAFGPVLSGWTWPGWIGVEIFFLLSGYVIMLSTARLLACRHASGAFLRRRALRLLPAAWLCASVSALVALALGRLPVGLIYAGWGQALLLLPGAVAIDGSYWTLPIEVAFYLLVAAAMLAPGGAPAMPERVATLLTLGSAGFWLAQAVGGMAVPDRFDLLLLPHGAFFALGIWLSCAHAGRMTPGRAVLFAIAAVAAALQIVARSTDLAGRFGLPDRPLVPLALFVAGAALVATGQMWQRPLARVGAGRLRALGLASYPLYLLHQHVGAAAILRLRAAGLTAVASVTLVALAMIAASLAIAQGAEPWLRSRLADALTPRRRAPRRDSRPIASPPAG